MMRQHEYIFNKLLGFMFMYTGCRLVVRDQLGMDEAITVSTPANGLPAIRSSTFAQRAMSSHWQ